MTQKNYYDHTRDHINSISPSFCAAKWNNATIWLGNGRTASCHHPAAHTIPLKELVNNPSALHNTMFKKEQRKKMLNGERPGECSYCWSIEDADPDVHSDRTYKSAIYTTDEIDMLTTIGWDADVDPTTLEISFDNLCNMSCSYCNPEFSSTWAKDIKKNGIYEDLQSSGGGAYQNDGSHAHTFNPKTEENLYVTSFFKWFDDSLKDNLQELRVTGGEPCRSPAFWKLVDKCEGADFRFAVNSNLIMDQKRMQKLIDCTKRFAQFDLYTSCESYKSSAELIRHGFDYDMWISNLRQFATDAKYKHINIMMTINALALFSMTDFIDDIISLKQEFNDPTLFSMSFNILRFPSFQSVNMLPAELKNKLANQFEMWLKSNVIFLSVSEHNQFKRVITYLRKVDKSYEDNDSIESKQHDFVKFFNAYTKRRGIDIVTQMNNADFTEWWNSLNE